jgi:predicted RNA binding protein YcfA (HicA-like mRNA interferase family)
MPPLPVLSGKDCIKALGKVGYRVDRTRGSHAWLVAPGRPSLPVPLHPVLDRGTLRSIMRRAGLSVETFLALLD